MNNTPQRNPAQQLQGHLIQTIEKQESYQGPLPDPLMLEGYKKADPSFPERIIKMAEAHNFSDIKTKNRISLSNLIVPIIGQVFTFSLGLGGILGCVYLAKSGATEGAIASIVGGFSPMVIHAINGLIQGKNK